MRTQKKRWGVVSGHVAKAAVAGTALVAGCITIGGSAGAATGSAPGVTSNSITVGTISTQTGPIASNFSSLIYGEKAYFDYVDATGGINGRKINYKYALDDAGNVTTFNQLASTLINQDPRVRHHRRGHGVRSPPTTSSRPRSRLTATTSRATGPTNRTSSRLGARCSFYPAEAPELAYPAKKLKAKTVAFLAYGVASSAAACQAAAKGMSAAGYKVGYTDYKINYPGTTVATDVQRMKQAGVDMILSCLDVKGKHQPGSGRAAVRDEDFAVVAEWERPGDIGGEPELDARCLLRHPARALHRSDVGVSGAQAVP